LILIDSLSEGQKRASDRPAARPDFNPASKGFSKSIILLEKFRRADEARVLIVEVGDEGVESVS
jgi:hypothetical protein